MIFPSGVFSGALDFISKPRLAPKALAGRSFARTVAAGIVGGGTPRTREITSFGIGGTADPLATFQPQMRRPTVTERWAEMAKEARAIAMRTRDPAAKERMLEIAASYDRLAKRSEDLARRRSGEHEPASD
jgi:hypothetical protein